MIDIYGQGGDYSAINITNCSYINATRCDYCYNLNYSTYTNPVNYYSDTVAYPLFIIGLANSLLTITNSKFKNL